MLLDTMFISAIGACVTRRAQPNVETNSGNSDKNGATHCTRKNWLMPNAAATAIIEFKKGCAVAYNSAPPTANRPPIAAFCRQPRCRYAQRETRGASASDSTSRGGLRIRIQRYPTYKATSTAASIAP